MDLIAKKIERLKRFIPETDSAFFQAELTGLRTKFENDYLYVVVVGLFKRGKSSLINALLKADLAPVAVTPLTSVVTFFKYSEESYAEVQFSDGTNRRISFLEISEYVAEEKNPENNKGVNAVTVFHSAPLLRKLVLIDTPGLGSVYEHNSATTIDFIPKIDVALLVLSADMPISKADMEFIERMQATVPKMLFVLNKCDLLTDHNLSEMIDYDRKVIAHAVQTELDHVQLIAASAAAVKNQFGTDHVLEELQLLVESEKNAIISTSVNRQLDGLKQQLTGILQLRLDTMLMPLVELEQRVCQFSEAKKLLTDNKSEFENFIAFKIKQIDQFVHDTVIAGSAALEIDIRERLNSLSPEQLSDNTCQEKLKGELDELMRETYTNARKQLQTDIKNSFSEILAEHSQRAQSFFNELVRQFSLLMNLDLKRVTDQFDLDVYTSFYLTYDTDESLITTNLKLWSRLFPEREFRQTKNRWLSHYKKLQITNNAAVIYDLQYKSQEALRGFIAEINRELQTLLSLIEATMESTMSDKQRSLTNQQEKISRLESQLSELATI